MKDFSVKVVGKSAQKFRADTVRKIGQVISPRVLIENVKVISK